MAERVHLTEVLGVEPAQTYLGGRYVNDICRLSSIKVDTDKRPTLEGQLHFDRSALAESSLGFHLSAINVQMLIPTLCEELARAFLVQHHLQPASMKLHSAVQHYQRYVTEQQEISCKVELLDWHELAPGWRLEDKKAQEQPRELEYEFRYRFRSKGMTAFQGTMNFAVVPEVLHRAYSVPQSLEGITFTEGYALEEVFLEMRERSLKARIVSAEPFQVAHPLHPVQIHGATGQLMRILFCKLFGFERTSIIEARATNITQHYHDGETVAPAQVFMQADKNVHLFPKSNVTWVFTNCQYSLGGTYLQGSVQVACPLPLLNEQQYKVLQENFTLI